MGCYLNVFGNIILAVFQMHCTMSGEGMLLRGFDLLCPKVSHIILNVFKICLCGNELWLGIARDIYLLNEHSIQQHILLMFLIHVKYMFIKHPLALENYNQVVISYKKQFMLTYCQELVEMSSRYVNNGYTEVEEPYITMCNILLVLCI